MIETLLKLVFVYIPLGMITYGIVTTIFPPFTFPNNIPTIPFYVLFLSTYTTMDQEDIFNIYLREKLERYGAVKIYFASRWNILITRPEYLKQVFQDEITFAKSGNHIKIPRSILAEYTGENIISAHGRNWKVYRQLLTSAIQFPNLEAVKENAQKLVSALESKASDNNALFIGDLIQKVSLQNVGQCFFGINFHLFDKNSSQIHEKLKFVKSQIFKPLFLNFPVLDNCAFPSRNLARKAVINFRNFFCDLIKEGQKRYYVQSGVGRELLKALQLGVIDEKQFQDNTMIIMIAGHENPQLLLSSLMYVLAKNPTIQAKLRDEIISTKDKDAEIEYLNAVIYETLRMYPPLGQIINRCTTKDTILGGKIRIPKGVYVGYNNFATGRDKNVWEDADCFFPERWGFNLEQINLNYTKAKSNATLPAFHGRKRACLGEKFALYEMKQCLIPLLLNYKLDLADDWKDKLTPGGPVSPLNLKLIFTKLN